MNESVKAPPPIMGSISIFLPAFGAALWWFVATHPKIGGGMNGYAGLFICLGLIALSGILVLAGILCGILGLLRGERWRFLAVLGLLINVVIVLRFKR